LEEYETVETLTREKQLEDAIGEVKSKI